ncbi:UNVERIFIED_CONTAM: hypothetical protein GTU68_032830 [Idotea baltica]|nr:hypothetical protein [Idotea baltica]
MTILVDADACPVKEEIYRVALRHEVSVYVIANQRIRTPSHPSIKFFKVDDGFDAADDAIAEVASPKTIVVTSDILLAERVLNKGAACLSPTGKEFTDADIGNAVATRAIMADLRAGGEQIGGPKPFSKQDRSKFLQELDRLIIQLKRR